MKESFIRGGSELTAILFIVMALGGISMMGACVYHAHQRITELEQNTCNCSVNYGGHNMSVEDAFERAGEGLTVDQADEVQILIEEYCK